MDNLLLRYDCSSSPEIRRKLKKVKNIMNIVNKAAPAFLSHKNEDFLKVADENNLTNCENYTFHKLSILFFSVTLKITGLSYRAGLDK